MNKIITITLLTLAIFTGSVHANKKLIDLGKAIISSSKNAAKLKPTDVGKRAMALQEKWGDDALMIAKKHGVRSLKAIEESGEHGGTLIRLQKHLGEGAIYLAKNKQGLTIIGKLGDDVAPSLVKHGASANDLLKVYGTRASKALTKVDRRGCAQLNQLHDAKIVGNTGNKAKLFNVVEKYGQRGLDFIWKNKKKLAAAGVLATFVVNPEPYINGTIQLADSAMDKASDVGNTIAAQVNWNLWIGITIALSSLIIFIKFKSSKPPKSNETQ